MTQEHTDEELALMTRTQTYAFGVLMERYEAKLLRYIMRSSHVTREGAEDLLQESFLKAYQNINSFDADLSFSSWIYRIVHNTVVSSWRKAHVRPEGHAVQVDETFFARVAADDDLAREIDQKFLADHIQELFSEMSDKYREVLILVFLEDKSYKEIAEILKKPMGTVATLINRAKKQFHGLYTKHYDTQE